MNFTEIMNTCYTIKNISSTNEKKAFLQSIVDEDFKNFLKWLFDSSIISGLSDKKINKVVQYDIFDDFTTCDIKNIFDVFRYLQFHKTGTDEDIKTIQWYRNQICKNDEEVEFFNRVATKNVVIGIDTKLINSVWNGLIPTFDVMLADKFLDLDEKALNRISNNRNREFVLQEKLDGVRCVAIKDNGNVKFVSRQGKTFENLVMLEKVLRNIPIDNFVLDGELIITDRKSIPSGEQYKATIKTVTVKDKEIDGVTLNVFDYLPLSEWNGKNCTLSYSERYDILMSMFNKLELEPYFHLVENIYIGNDLERVLIELTKARNNNWEGIMLRWLDSKYEFKRSKELLKVKPFKELDAYIVGYEEGTNKLVNTLGSFICEIEYKDYGKLKFKCGSGYTEEERNYYWSIKDELIGRVIEVQFFEITQDSKTKEYSVRFPVHKCIKDIGTVPNN